MATLLGDSVAPYGPRVWLGTLIGLLSILGINERLTRTSVFRLVEDGWLLGQRSGRRSLYALTATGLRHIEHAQRRIYAPPGAAWDGRWTLLVVGPQSLDARLRGELKRELEWEGFAALAPGLYGHPSYQPDSVREILRGLGVEEQVTLFAGQHDELAPAGQARALVLRNWPIDALGARYAEFVERHAAILPHIETADGDSAFVVRTLVIHAYRRLVLHDPQLPAALLPPDWAGLRAYELTRTIYRRLAPAADAFVIERITAESGAPARANPAYNARFAAAVALAPQDKPGRLARGDASGTSGVG